MTRADFDFLFRQFKIQAYAYIRARAPYRRGKLKGSIRSEDIEGGGFQIIIDISYVVYTEEKWISPKWNGRENPNLYWIREAVARLADRFAQSLKGVVVRVS